ncbi:Quinate dehydrogenase [Cyphellophora attinorum]|uniref:Quinate dehydrogenase n=1 Tax=Cyphellophora attinorum TaxID=1664694 RepID=A0A0N1P284_9EURO|nr:Quinate dehydrogenase [Phialophora attinorum]KPI43336.1 Quinate dehydrogenase [Phialophora attinorum]
MGSMAEDQRTSTYLVGIGVTHSIAPPMHDYVAQQLHYNWKFHAQECPTVEDAVRLFREPTFAGGVVTMPYKVSIMQHLDGLDHHAKLLKACNNVYRAKDGTLRGTNTDWRGIKGCLASATASGTCEEGKGRPALLVGAGGASRAAVYVLYHELKCRPIYVVNRDEDEVAALLKDVTAYGSDDIELVHLQTVDAAKEIFAQRGAPFYVVGTVPDFAPQTETEIECAKIIETAFASAKSGSSAAKGVVLDMCFKPRRTRTLKLAQRYGWVGVEGTGVIGHQINEQYRLWLTDGEGESPITGEIQSGAWKVLNEAAEASTAIN